MSDDVVVLNYTVFVYSNIPVGFEGLKSARLKRQKNMKEVNGKKSLMSRRQFCFSIDLVL